MERLLFQNTRIYYIPLPIIPPANPISCADILGSITLQRFGAILVIRLSIKLNITDLSLSKASISLQAFIVSLMSESDSEVPEVYTNRIIH